MEAIKKAQAVAATTKQPNPQKVSEPKKGTVVEAKPEPKAAKDAQKPDKKVAPQTKDPQAKDATQKVKKKAPEQLRKEQQTKNPEESP